jgi:hypothetical protein
MSSSFSGRFDTTVVGVAAVAEESAVTALTLLLHARSAELQEQGGRVEFVACVIRVG